MKIELEQKGIGKNKQNVNKVSFRYEYKKGAHLPYKNHYSFRKL